MYQTSKMNVSITMNNMMSGMMRSVANQVIEGCALKYGFDADEAKLSLNLSVKDAVKKMSTEKAVNVKASFPLPFNGEHSDENCQALRQNNGLYTQCQGKKKEGAYCKSCSQLASKSESGVPEYGTITDRLASEPMDYTDPKGRKPTSYTKVMKKYKLTEEQVLEEAAKLGITINQVHFVVPEETKRGRPSKEPKEAKEPKGSKGRPKKSTKVVTLAEDEDDLFASLVASAASSEEVEEEVQEEDQEEEKAAKEEEKAAKALKVAEEKAAKTQKLAEEKAAKAQKLAEEKEAKAQKLAEEKEAKAQKLAEEKEAKALKATEEKEAKTQKLAEEKAAKALKVTEEKAAKAKKVAKKVPKEEEKEEEETYKKCGEGKYIRSQQTGIVYDYAVYTETGELVPAGKWNAEKKEIVFENADDSDSELVSEEPSS
jgi:chemotaxis protein histidine kinase CheA